MPIFYHGERFAASGVAGKLRGEGGNRMKKMGIICVSIVVLFAIVFVFSFLGFAQGKVVKIGFIGPLTGPNAAQGVGARNAFDLAVREANASGKLPYKLEMAALDD